MKNKFEKPVIFISKCINIDSCRFNGEIVRDDFLLNLGKYVNYVYVCPEVYDYYAKYLYELLSKNRTKINIINTLMYDISNIPEKYKKDFTPTSIDISISKERLKSKIDNKKGFYKINGKLI